MTTTFGMSASEKLKALVPLGSTYGGPAEAALMRSLPQIVAVVEAAEAFKLDQHAALRESDTPWLRITRALAALDEALS